MYKQNPLLVGKAITEFLTIMELAKRENCRLVFASTSSIYNGNPIPWKEDMPIHVTDFYSEARHYMERLARFYHDVHGTRSIGLRFFSVYGPREEAKKNYANLVTQFAWDMKKGEQPVIYGDGEQRRDFTFVEDVVAALRLSMNSKISLGVYNVGTGQSYSLNELIDMLNKVIGTELRPKYIVNQIKNYVQDTLADTEKAETELGFKARYSLEEGMKKYL
jgi:UDP-glucose 4-epimerase